MTTASSYGRLDRALHRLAFKAIPTQLALADIEERLYPVGNIRIERPVFVTSLARAGTTLLLNLLNEAPELVSHTYRNMPFVLCPVLWQRISGPFRQSARARERSHGDGVAIDFDSPEAFEEVLWKAFWPEHYRQDRIALWETEEAAEDFAHFFQQHIRKILSLAPRDVHKPRYLSKNNANIARLLLLAAMFPDCRIIVPVRNPFDHARSLLRQHERFTAMHAEDGFSRSYMEWLGHYEFGAALKPMDFKDRDGQSWLDQYEGPGPGHLDFWLAYWCAAYEGVLRTAGPNVTFIDYDALCAAPRRGLDRLAKAAALPPNHDFGTMADRLRPPTDYSAEPPAVGTHLVARAGQVHGRLLAEANRPIVD